jgi:hypothetical protein
MCQKCNETKVSQSAKRYNQIRRSNLPKFQWNKVFKPAKNVTKQGV